MKVLILSTKDTSGGAARAAYRLHKGLQDTNVESEMIVQTKFSNDNTVHALENQENRVFRRLRRASDKLALKMYRYKKAEFSTQWFPDRVFSEIERMNPEIINLHWVNRGFIKIETLSKIEKPIVWTLHDMWPFTGGCHYSQTCQKYESSCGDCPQLGSNKEIDLSRRIWHRKVSAWRDINLTVVTPSQWLASCAKASSLFNCSRVQVIPNGIDTEVYKPFEKKYARDLLGLPQNKQLLLFCSINARSAHRKGFHLLESALKELRWAYPPKQLDLVIVGETCSRRTQNLFGFTVHSLGRISSDSNLAAAYSSADAFVAPSLQDNLPNTVMEALACGTPSVAFNIGGMPDLIQHKINGFLAKPFNASEISSAITWVLEDKDRHNFLSINARKLVEQQFTYKIQADRYQDLFESLCSVERCA